MSERADQVVLEYLRRVADAAYGVLRSDERLEFLARLRRRIDEVRIRQKAHKPAQVQRIIDRLGPPEALVEEERLRLAAERPEDPPRPRNTTPPPAPAPSGADTKNPTVVTEREPEPEPEHPFNQTQPIPVIDDAALERDTVATPYPSGPADEMEEVREEPAEVEAAAEPPDDEDEPSEPEGPVPVASGGSRTATRYPRRAAPSDVLAITGRGVPGVDAAPGDRRRADFLDVAARNKMASVTVILLGFGALALPVPLWLLGVVLLVLCQAWPLGDKMLGAAVPIVTAAVYGLATDQAASVLAMSAYTSAGAGGPRLAFGIGGLLGAAYLGFRLSRTTR